MHGYLPVPAPSFSLAIQPASLVYLYLPAAQVISLTSYYLAAALVDLGEQGLSRCRSGLWASRAVHAAGGNPQACHGGKG